MIALITGGSGSGKSAWAENLALTLCPTEKTYIATMLAFGEEGRQRVARHAALRAGKGFITREQPMRLEEVPIPPGGTALVECVSNLLANEMYDPRGAGEKACVAAIERGFDALMVRAGHLIIVSNEVFSDGLPYDDSTILYIRRLGEINRFLAERADLVVEVVYGLPVVWKGALPQ